MDQCHAPSALGTQSRPRPCIRPFQLVYAYFQAYSQLQAVYRSVEAHILLGCSAQDSRDTYVRSKLPWSCHVLLYLIFVLSSPSAKKTGRMIGSG